MSTARHLKRHATTLALITLAIAGGIGLIVFDRGTISTDEAKVRRKNLLPAFRGDEVTAITIAAHGSSARVVRGAKTDAGQRPWEIAIGDATRPAEEPAVDQLLAALRDGTVDRRVEEGALSLAAMGLDAPRATIDLAMENKSFRLVIGGPAPSPEGAVYAAVIGHGAAVIRRELAAALDVAPESLFSKTLLALTPAEASEVLLDGEGGARRLVRARGADVRGAGFSLDRPAPEGGPARADATALSKVWASIAELEATRFLPDAEADRALARRVSVTLVPANATAQRIALDLGGACPGHAGEVVAVRRSPSRLSACVRATAIEGLALPASELLDRHLFAAPIDEVTEVKLTGEGSSPLDLARKGTGFHARSPEDRDVDATVGRSFLTALLAVEASSIEAAPKDLAPLGLSPPRGTVQLVSIAPEPPAGVDAGRGERVEVVEIGAEQGGNVMVRRREDGTVAAVPVDRASPLFPSPFALRSKKVVSEPLPSITAMTVIQGGRTQRVERRADGVFALVEPAIEGTGADAIVVAELAEAAGGLFAERWVGKALPEHGLDAPRVAIEIGIGERKVKIFVGAPTGNGYFAKLAGDETVFIAGKKLVDAASAWLIDREVAALDAALVTRVTLAAPEGKKTVIEQVNGVFRVAGEAPSAAGSARAASVRDAVADLKAEVVASVGAPEPHQGFAKPRLNVTIERSSGAPIKIAIGAGDALSGTSIAYVRRDGAALTYAVAQAKIRPLFAAIEEAK